MWLFSGGGKAQSLISFCALGGPGVLKILVLLCRAPELWAVPGDAGNVLRAGAPFTQGPLSLTQ